MIAYEAGIKKKIFIKVFYAL